MVEELLYSERQLFSEKERKFKTRNAANLSKSLKNNLHTVIEQFSLKKMVEELLYSERELFSKKEPQFKTRNAANLSKSINGFTNDFHTCIASDDDSNFVSSGLSAHLVLAMCSLGARKNTLEEMHEVLHLSKNTSLDNFKKFILNLNNSCRVTLGVVNRIYTDKRIIVKHHFKRDVQNFFHSDVIDTDFLEVDETVKTINDWCAQQTRNKIKEIVTKEDILPTTRLILTNAVYFKAKWLNQFASFCTVKKPFHIDERTTIVIPTMQNSNPLFYKNLANVEAECIGLPYEDQDFVFVVIRPKQVDGLDYVEENLADIDLNYQDDFRNSENIRHIHLSLPKFKIESTIQLTDYLQKLGMTEAFDGDNANFKGISEKPKLKPVLHVDKVLQKAFIEVTEEGTEAAAFTYIRQVGGGGGPMKTIEWFDFKVDRPFLYRIVNVSSNVVLFSGRVTKPDYF